MSINCGATCCYLARNWSSCVPVAIALIVLSISRQTMVLPADCPPKGIFVTRSASDPQRGNPMLCPGRDAMREMFAAAQARLARSARNAAQASGQTASEQSASADSESKIAKADADRMKARADQAKAEIERPGITATAKTSAQGSLATANIDASRAASAAADKQYAATVALDKAKDEGALNGLVLREARARLFWVGSFGLSLVAAVATLIGALWVLAVATGDHLRPEGRRNQLARGFWSLILLMAVSTICLVGVWLIANELVQVAIFQGVEPVPILSTSGLLVFDDAITTYMFGGSAELGHFLPGGRSLIEAGSLVISIAVIALGGAVAATLYQQPEQAQTRRAGNAHDQVLRGRPTADHGPSDDDILAYNRFLSRCFERLNTCIYMGATLMVLCVVHVSAQYSWLAALFDPAATDEPFKSVLPTAFQTLAGEFTFEYGIIFTALLTSLFLPTWLVLQRRAWEAARAQNAGGATETELQKWLDDRGMSFRAFQQYGQILTLLAPTGAATFVTFLKGFSGG